MDQEVKVKEQEKSDREKMRNTVPDMFEKNRLMVGVGVILSATLFAVWTFRAGLQWTTSIIVILMHILACVIVSLNDYREYWLVDKNQIHIRKTGVSWKLVTDALIGLGLAFFFIWFVLSSNEANSVFLSEIVMQLAMVCTTLVMPIIPLLGMIRRLDIFKTEIIFSLDEQKEEDVTVKASIHPFDIEIKKLEEDSVLEDALTESLRTLQLNSQ